tara:strand:- start:360 stop:482 length:123 start_codon:yes stop_codon:yes gene_type:complete
MFGFMRKTEEEDYNPYWDLPENIRMELISGQHDKISRPVV